jgi:hypothetical protein
MSEDNSNASFCIDLHTFMGMSSEDRQLSKAGFERMHQTNPNLQFYVVQLSNNKLGIISDKFISEKLGCLYSLSIINSEAISDLTYEKFAENLTNE